MKRQKTKDKARRRRERHHKRKEGRKKQKERARRNRKAGNGRQKGKKREAANDTFIHLQLSSRIFLLLLIEMMYTRKREVPIHSSTPPPPLSKYAER